MSFGSRLRELRTEKGLSQKQISDLTGLSQQAIATWETDKNSPSWPAVQKLTAALGVSCEALTEADSRDLGRIAGKKWVMTAATPDQIEKLANKAKSEADGYFEEVKDGFVQLATLVSGRKCSASEAMTTLARIVGNSVGTLRKTGFLTGFVEGAVDYGTLSDAILTPESPSPTKPGKRRRG
jgi:transcriptional regulator with XRE-family HTH domain